MTTGRDSWSADWSDTTAVVLGCGDVGFAIADTLHELGAHTIVVSQTPDADQEKILRVLGVAVVEDAGGDTVLPSGVTPDVCVLSAPVYRSHPLALAWRDAEQSVWSEVEFSYRVADKSGERPRFVFVAGHGHAGDAADLAQRVLDYAGLRSIVVGSLGAVALDVLRDPTPWDVVVWPLGGKELLDLALDTTPLRSPFVSVALDADSELSAEAIGSVYFQTTTACIYSRGGGLTERCLEEAWVHEGCRAIGIGLDTPGMSDLGIVDGIVCDRAFIDNRRHEALELTTVAEIESLGFGDHDSVGRLVTALAIARAMGVTPEEIGGALGAL